MAYYHGQLEEILSLRWNSYLFFYSFLIITMFAFISGLFLWVLIIGCCCLRKSKLYEGLSKLSIALFLFFWLFLPNPALWPAQIANHVDISRIITPNEPLGQNLIVAMWPYLESRGYNQ